jgi:hypothetical protein
MEPKHLLFIVLGILLFLLLCNKSEAQTDSTNVSWNVNPESDMLEYRLYRGDNGSPLALLYTIPHPQVTIGDTNNVGPGNLYCYSLVAVDSGSNISEFSDTVCVGVPQVILTLVVPVQGDTTIPLANIATDPDLQPIGVIPENPVNCTVSTDASFLYLNPIAAGPGSFDVRAVDLDGFWDRKTVAFVFTDNPPLPPDSVRVTK